jgi:hypothetical protein
MGNYDDHMFYAKRWLFVVTLVLFPLAFAFGALDMSFIFFYLTGAFIMLGGAMLPDFDSPRSTPAQLARQITNTLFIIVFSAVTAAILHFFFEYSAVEMIPYIFSAIVLAVGVNWTISYYVMRELTDHRGHFHSIGAGVLYAFLIFLIFLIGFMFARITMFVLVMMPTMAFLGYLSHLTCDEIFSAFKEEDKEEAEQKFRNWLVSWRHIWFDSDGKKKSSAGTAFKWWK